MSKLATLALVCLGGMAAQNTQTKEKRQLGQIAEIAGFQQKKSDLLIPAAAGFVQQPAAPVAQSASGQYFQYAHQPDIDHYEHGHKRGHEHHFIERHEKGHPHAGEFKTKVRWGDKHGGYGEHYWDFNHAGHDDDGEESQHNEAYEEYSHEPSESESLPFLAADTSSSSTNQVAPKYASDVSALYQQRGQSKSIPFLAAGTSSSSTHQASPKYASGVSPLYQQKGQSKPQSFVAADASSSSTKQAAPIFAPGVSALFETTNVNQQRGKRNPDDDVEFVDENARSRILDGSSPKHGGNYRKAKEEYRTKRHPVEAESTVINPLNLFFDASSGYIVDQITGRQFKLSLVQ